MPPVCKGHPRAGDLLHGRICNAGFGGMTCSITGFVIAQSSIVFVYYILFKQPLLDTFYVCFFPIQSVLQQIYLSIYFKVIILLYLQDIFLGVNC